MEKSENQKLVETLVEHADCLVRGRKLYEYRVYDLVEKLCQTVMGSMHLTEAVSGNLNQKTRNCINAILYWVKDDIDGRAESANTRVQLITPFQIASIGAAVGVIAWSFNNPSKGFATFVSIAGVSIIVTIFSVIRYKFSYERNTFRELSNRTESLLKIVQNSNTP